MSNILSNPEEFEQQECIECGCSGNVSCGHEPLNEDCSLDQTLVCPCCNIKRHPETKKNEKAKK
jgi:hypothetical protein